MPSQDIETTQQKVAAGDGMVRALLAERAGLLRAGKAGRVAQVDEQLRVRGYPTDGLPAPQSAGVDPQPPDAAPRGRRAPKPDRTTDGQD
ncbi:MAG TPA: hypothetical protein VFM55_18810 [Micromonosporaceae bacterium]|nr:hypothetical protein [Micromonosporaceae bacterium]